MTKAKDRWNKKTYDQINIRVPKGKKAEIVLAAKNAGMSLNAYIVQSIEKNMNQFR